MLPDPTADRRPVVAMLLYPALTQLDLTGPHQVLSVDMDVHLAWKTLDPVTSDTGMVLQPTVTLADCPRDVDVLMVPGGLGTKDMMVDTEVLDWLREIAPRARYVTSVCTGSLVLGAAGLLEGYRATTHWSTRQHLAALGAESVVERVVVDRNRITGGGVTAGMDFGLTVVAELLGDERAQAAQLVLEYDPKPPFDAGVPERAPHHLVEGLLSMLEGADEEIVRSIELARTAGRVTAPIRS